MRTLRGKELIYRLLAMSLLLYCFTLVEASPGFRVSLVNDANEFWYGGSIADAHLMPMQAGYSSGQLGYNAYNQVQPLFISNMGRYIWCEDPLKIKVTEDSLVVSSAFSEIISGKAGESLKDAYLYCSNKFFPPAGAYPDELLFTAPQYNTWIELMYDQNQDDILSYAQKIIDNDFPPGVLMIDDNWQEDYGNWEFKSKAFQDPRQMIQELKARGFKVMLWVCPFVSADSKIYRELRDKKWLIRNAEKPNEPAIIRWWNGYSAHIDLTHPDAVQWFKDQLDYLMDTYGVDGFKLDAGDFRHS
jgi:alpha-glucosidase